MPELPEVETTCRALQPVLTGNRIAKVVIREARLRWEIPAAIARIKGQLIISLERRAKYLLLKLTNGSVILHLGMSGKLAVVPANTPLKKHDHVDLVLDNGLTIRYNDPRRFGCILWTTEEVSEHKLLRLLGPEPFAPSFNAQYLLEKAIKRKKMPVKQFIMDNAVVVGVGNIYASEALFKAKISPIRLAASISLKEYTRLIKEIKLVLLAAIEKGGTTLRDFLSPDGKKGYFVNELMVYNRENASCNKCASTIIKIRLGGRSSFYCPSCQL